MAQPLDPRKAQSIEDLFKKTDASLHPAAPTSDQSVVIGAAPKKVKKSTEIKPASMLSPGEKLDIKQSEIKLQTIEQEAKAEADAAGFPYINLKGFPISPEALVLLPREEAERTNTIVFYRGEDELRLANPHPGPETRAIAERLAKQEHANVQIYLASEPCVQDALHLYATLPETPEAIYGIRIDEEELKRYEKEISSFRDLQEKIGTVSTTDIITLMLGAALKSEASDIHVEAEEDDIKLRFRIDGLLQDAAKIPRDAWKQMISRLKLLAEVKINIEGLPQDGRITIYLAKEKIDIRVSFLPTAFGESVVMRVLRPKVIALEFDNLGVRGRAWEQLQREIDRPNGMIITTGPTGSGKTTTLYAILKKVNSPEVKIITLEDPVEYKLQGINQSQIDHEKKYDFAKGLRSILRQDPDIVMVGEIRDLETADIAIQAALTGHLVISTLHTNSAAAAIPRFLSMGVKPFLLAPAINAIIGQRLVRRLCDTCKTKITLDPAVLKQVKDSLNAIPKNSGYNIDTTKDLVFYGPPAEETPCEKCHKLRYKGRIGVYEIMVMSKEIEHLILNGNVSEYQMFDIAIQQGMITMVQDGLLKALDGMTSVEEILRVADIQAVTEDVPETTPQTTQ